MLKKFRPRTILLSALIVTTSLTISFAQTAPALPLEIQRQGGVITFFAQPGLSSFRAALYNQQGVLIAESGAEAMQRWQVPTPVQSGVYLAVFWLRGQHEATKRLARLEVQATTQKLQSVEQYLQEVKPPASVQEGTSAYRTSERRAYQRGLAAIPLLRAATKILPNETAAYLLLVQAIRIKYGQFDEARIALPLPPPPPPIAGRRKNRSPESIVENKRPTPTPEEQREMLAAGQKALAVAKTCTEKTEALRWLATIQAELNQSAEQLATLEQITQASCATKEVKAQIWYIIGVYCWQCCYELTTRAADVRRLSEEPFHLRTFTKTTDQERFAACWQKGMSALEHALALQPNYAEALSYQSLLYRERQKTAASPDERLQAAATAEQLIQQAVELFRQRRAR